MAEARPLFLLCFDGSESATHAIREGGEITGGGPALVVYAWLPPSSVVLQGRTLEPTHPMAAAVGEFDSAARAAAEGVAGRGVEVASEAGFDPEPLAIAVPGGVWRPLVELAEQRQARAVIVGSHGLSRVKSALLGSVSHGIVNHCKRPVIVVPP